MDAITINDLLLTVPLEAGARWEKPGVAVEQPISVSLSIFHDVSSTARTDDLSFSLNYSSVAKCIRKCIAGRSFSHLRDVSCHVSDALADALDGRCLDGLRVRVKVIQLKSPLHTKTVAIEHLATFRADRSWLPSNITHLVEDLSCDAIVGIHPHERAEKQDVLVNLAVESEGYGLDGELVDFRLITRTIYDKISSSSYQTLEALTSSVASTALGLLSVYDSPPTVSVRVAKPSALVFAGAAEVQLRRNIYDFPTVATNPQLGTSHPHIAAIALGSNLGDTFCNIEYALRLLESPLQLDTKVASDAFVHVVDTSFLYESKPMYVENQPSFVNGACTIETNLPSDVLLRLLKAVELKVGRVPSIRNGPRAIDLDIIFYDNDVIDTRQNTKDFDNVAGELIVPHPRLQEREFVLRPLNDIIPDYVHPVLMKTVETLFHKICDRRGSPMKKIFPFPRVTTSAVTPHETQFCWSYSSNNMPDAERCRTQVMATVNVTPDSFSDGGVHDNVPAALSYISSSVFAGATIVDIGGYSTRPGAAFVSVEDEINRVVPVIRAMRDRKFLEGMTHAIAAESDEEIQRHVETILTTPISIDTFRWQVAEAAIEAGANCMNDVCAFGGRESWRRPAEANEYTVRMKAIARKWSVPVILMHSRGDAGSNKDYGAFSYAADEKGSGMVLEGVRVELGARVDLVTKGRGGLRRWLVIVDPGIGFSKPLQGNLEVLRSAEEVVGYTEIGNAPRHRNPLRGFPLLIGPSRKSFLGEILLREPARRRTVGKERTYATAGAVACAVRQNACMIVRVHDVQEMMDVVKTTEAIYF